MSLRALAKATLWQAWTEITLTLRRGESLLVTVIIPAGLLAFFASARVFPAAGRSISFLLPGTLALAVISTGLVSLGIATAYERYYGVLKRFGLTPFPRSGLIAAKLIAVLAIEALQTGILVAVSIVLFGWRPSVSLGFAALGMLLGTAAFSGLGLAMAGTFRAEATLATANGLFLFFLLLGGLYVPLDHIPTLLQPLARILPAYPLADMLRLALSGRGQMSNGSTLVLLFWALFAPAAAARFFRWE